MNFLQGLGGVGAGLMTANQILRQQKLDEENAKLRKAQIGLANAQLAKVQREEEDNAVLRDEASRLTQQANGTDADTINAKLNREQGFTNEDMNSAGVSTGADPITQRDVFRKLADTAMARGDQADYEKFNRFSDHLKQHQKEGATDLARMIYSGNVDPSAAEKAFNAAGEVRVVPGSAKWDADTGTISGIDASTGRPLSMNRDQAHQHLIMAGVLKPDTWTSTGQGTMGNTRTGEVKGEPRTKPLVVNGAIFEQQTDDNGNSVYRKVAEAQRQPSVVIHQGRGGNGDLTTPQLRANDEIDAARQALAGMDRAEVMRKTQPATATGRNNPDYDPQLAGQWKLANRRKYGDDHQFDQFTQQRPSAAEQVGSGKPSIAQDLSRMKQQSDITKRMAADPSMKGMRAGKLTPQGLEVLDNNGRIIGHYN